MVLASTIWLNLLLSRDFDSARPAAAERKPMEIEVDRLPDYVWRDLGFQQPRRPDGE